MQNTEKQFTVNPKIFNFTDLIVWQESRKLCLSIYKATDIFPKSEIYALVNQMRRCAISIISNIAEGFSRQGKREKIQFYYTAKGSLTELESQVIIAFDLNYIDQSKYDQIISQIRLKGKLLIGLITKTKTI